MPSCEWADAAALLPCRARIRRHSAHGDDWASMGQRAERSRSAQWPCYWAVECRPPFHWSSLTAFGQSHTHWTHRPRGLRRSGHRMVVPSPETQGRGRILGMGEHRGGGIGVLIGRR